MTIEMLKAGLEAAEFATRIQGYAKEHRDWALVTISTLIESVAEVTGESPNELAVEIACAVYAHNRKED